MFLRSMIKNLNKFQLTNSFKQKSNAVNSSLNSNLEILSNLQKIEWSLNYDSSVKGSRISITFFHSDIHTAVHAYTEHTTVTLPNLVCHVLNN